MRLSGQPKGLHVKRRAFTVVLVPTGPRGHPCGAPHWNARHSDDVVARALALHAAGQQPTAISWALGVCRRTVRQWLSGTRRRPAARLIARRRPVLEQGVAPPDLSKSFDANHQRIRHSLATVRVSWQDAGADTDKPTDID